MKITLKYIAFTAFTFFILNLLTIDLGASPMNSANSAQQVDLVKLKKDEEERKKKTKKSKYVVTNDNLDKIETPKKPYSVVKVGEKGSKDAASGVKTASEALPGGETAVDAVSNRKSKDYWQGKKRDLLSQINQVKEELNAAEAEQKKLMLSYSAIDSLAERTRLKNRVTELLELIPELNRKLTKLDKDLEELEDQARKAGVPAGWLRDIEKLPPSKSGKDKAGATDK
ncbi:MAG: hypothetical protein GY950_12100 [bacterium]|nr:hypothetical protein [bacterium]